MGWMRENLFSSIHKRSILTLWALYHFVYGFGALVPWFFQSGSGPATSLAECREIRELRGDRTGCVLLGPPTGGTNCCSAFYPSEAYWRPQSWRSSSSLSRWPRCLFSHLPRKLLIVTAVYPFIASSSSGVDRSGDRSSPCRTWLCGIGVHRFAEVAKRHRSLGRVYLGGHCRQSCIGCSSLNLWPVQFTRWCRWIGVRSSR